VRREHHQYFHDPSPLSVLCCIPNESGCWKAMTPEVCVTNNWTMVSTIPWYRWMVLGAAKKQKVSTLRLPQYEGIANTIVQLIRRSTSGVIASWRPIHSRLQPERIWACEI
jgi:hypothetical protein